MIINDSITGLDFSTVLFIGVVYANAHTFVHTEAKSVVPSPLSIYLLINGDMVSPLLV